MKVLIITSSLEWGGCGVVGCCVCGRSTIEGSELETVLDGGVGRNETFIKELEWDSRTVKNLESEVWHTKFTGI